LRSGELYRIPWPIGNGRNTSPIHIHVEGNVDSDRLRQFGERAIGAYLDSGLFSPVMRGHNDRGGLSVVIEVQHAREESMALTLFSGLTLFLVPSRSSDRYQVVTTFRDARGRTLASTEARATQTVWRQLFLVFAMPFKRDATPEIFYDLSRHGLIQAADQGIF